MTNCKQCGKEIEESAEFCTYCGTANDFNSSTTIVKHKKKHHNLFILLYILGAFAVIAATVAILNANLLLPWQRGARRNKQVILEYAEEHYPDAKVIEENYNSAKFFIWNNFEDGIVFNLDGLRFGITAEGGKIITDGYYGARAIAQFDKIIQDGFLKPRGAKATVVYGFVDGYRKSYPYTGRLSIGIEVFNRDITPREVGWFYDFYKYWKNEGAFLAGYGVEIRISLNKEITYHIHYDNNSEFPNEDSFYAAFETGH